MKQIELARLLRAEALCPRTGILAHGGFTCYCGCSYAGLSNACTKEDWQACPYPNGDVACAATEVGAISCIDCERGIRIAQ